LIWVAPSITWLLVSTRPEADRIIPVPSAVSLAYLSWEVMSTRPGTTLRLTAAWFRAAPVPGASSCGEGTVPEATPAGGVELGLSKAKVSPAPTTAATTATVR
jgi:hypothetical protein